MDAAHLDFIPPAVYAELLTHLHRTRSMLSPAEAVACALKLWMAQSAAARSPLRGYQYAARLRAQASQRLDQQPLSPAQAISEAAKAMNTTLSAAMLLIEHVDHQSTTIVERRLDKHRRKHDLMDDDY